MSITELCELINWWSILVAAFVGFGLGSIWHSKILFNKAWMKGHELKPNHAEGSNFLMLFGLTFIAFVVIAFGMQFLMHHLLGQILWYQGIVFGLFLSLFFVATTFGITFLFLRKSFTIWLVDAFYYIVAFALMGWILAAWN